MIDAQIAPEANLTPIYPGASQSMLKMLFLISGMSLTLQGAPQSEEILGREKNRSPKGYFSLSSTRRGIRPRAGNRNTKETWSNNCCRNGICSVGARVYSRLSYEEGRQNCGRQGPSVTKRFFNGVNFVQLHTQKLQMNYSKLRRTLTHCPSRNN